MRRLAAVAAGAAAALGAVAACGGESGDLMAIEVSGGFAGRGVHLRLTSDGRASCNGGPLHEVSSGELLDARAIERDIGDLAEKQRSFGHAARPDRRRYVARVRDGSVSWTEGERGLPAALPRAALLEQRLARLSCR
jgi:hypothetical protein